MFIAVCFVVVTVIVVRFINHRMNSAAARQNQDLGVNPTTCGGEDMVLPERKIKKNLTRAELRERTSAQVAESHKWQCAPIPPCTCTDLFVINNKEGDAVLIVHAANCSVASYQSATRPALS